MSKNFKGEFEAIMFIRKFSKGYGTLTQSSPLIWGERWYPLAGLVKVSQVLEFTLG